MSSILKALKKIEDDKAARRPDELKIDAEILRTDNTPRVSTAGILVASLLLLAGGSGVTYMYMKRDRPVEQITLKSAAMPDKPVPPVAEIKAELLPSTVVVVPANKKNTAKAENNGLRQGAKPAGAAPAVVASKASKPIETAKPVTQSNASKAPSPASPKSASAKAVPALRVNGIAFNDGGADSVAMINGVPASNGSMIEGVKVEEIFSNRVIFSSGGERFEIALGQSNR